MNFKKLSTQVIERIAPSPTGGLHLGHVYSAFTAYQNAKNNQGLFKLRIEDIDYTRCKLKFEKEIISNLSWLGISWDGQIMRQRNRKKTYASAIEQLLKDGLLYPCSCTRTDIKKAVSAPHTDENTNITYPWTCRRNRPTKSVKALRLDIGKAIKMCGFKKVSFFEKENLNNNFSGEQSILTSMIEHQFGDLVIARKDINTSYNLAVVIDDAAQMVTHVTRGNDLRAITPIQVLLQRLLCLPTPIYHHHKLLFEPTGKKISKRSFPDTVSSFKTRGFTPNDVIAMAFNL